MKQVHLEDSTHERLKKAAKKDGKKIGSMANELVLAGLRKATPSKKKP